MTRRKDFSILKWIIFPANSIILASVIVWFNLRVFGFEDGLPYSLVVGLIGVFSVIINRYTESDNRTLARAAFVFEIILTAALVCNAAYSISVQRKMSVARMGETSQKETITEIGKLRGSRTQREALKKLETRESAQSVFSDVERTLFWIMVGELALYAISAFTLFALAKLMDEKPAHSGQVSDDFPAELDVAERTTKRRTELAPKTPTRGDIVDDTHSQRKPTRADTDGGLKRLRECLKLIAFSHPPGHFKVDLKPDNAPPRHLIIRLVKSSHGIDTTAHSVRAKLSLLDDAIRMAPAAFRDRLEKFLKANGFQI